VTRLLRALVVVGGDARRGRAARGAATGVHATRDATCMATPIRARVAVTRARREIGLICSRSKHVHVLGRDERERRARRTFSPSDQSISRGLRDGKPPMGASGKLSGCCQPGKPCIHHGGLKSQTLSADVKPEAAAGSGRTGRVVLMDPSRIPAANPLFDPTENAKYGVDATAALKNVDIDELQAAADAATAREDAAFEALVLEKEQSGRIARGASFLTAKFALQSDPRFKAAKRRAEALYKAFVSRRRREEEEARAVAVAAAAARDAAAAEEEEAPEEIPCEYDATFTDDDEEEAPDAKRPRVDDEADGGPE
jgi:hypothetical protein